MPGFSRIGRVALAIAAASAFSTPGQAAPPRVRYDGDVVVAVHGAAPHQLVAMGIEPWDEHPADHPDAQLVARVPALARPQLDASGFAYRVLDPDLQATLDLQRTQRHASGARRPTEGWDDDFRTMPEVLARLQVLADAAPDLVTVLELGESVEGRPIRGLSIVRNPEAPRVLLNSGQHAREWLSVSTALAIADALIDASAEANTSVTSLSPEIAGRIDALLDEVGFIVVPVVNPDGYVYSWETDRLWRKNRRDGHGVDLNRNWGVAWGGPGSSGDTSKNNYRGTAAFSEPETVALRDLMLDDPQLVAHVDFHTFGQLVLYPWGFGEDLSPDDDELAPLAAELAETLTDVHGEYYEPRRAGTWYAASGNLLDWAYGELGLRSFTIELRPIDAETAALGFVAPATEIIPTGLEALEGVLAIAQWAVDLPTLPPGDDGEAPSTVEDTGADDATSTGGTTGDDGGGLPSTGEPETTAGGSDDAVPNESGTAEGTTDSAAAEDERADPGCSCRSGERAPTTNWIWIALLALTPAVRRSGGSRRRSRPR